MANDINTSTLLTGALGATQRAANSQPQDVARKTDSQAATGSDRVSVTSEASRLLEIEEQLMAVPEVNDSKVAEIKRAIADGTFDINPQRIADKLIAFETSVRR